MKNVIVDLDGTIALDAGRAKRFLNLNCGLCYGSEGFNKQCPKCHGRGFYHLWDDYYAACAEDEPNIRIIRLMHHLSYHYTIMILSGRRYDTMDVTTEWLKKYDVPYHFIWLRPTGDFTDDHIIKIEQGRKVSPPEETLFVLEDRSRVVEAWRAAGYTCLQVAPGAF